MKHTALPTTPISVHTERAMPDHHLDGVGVSKDSKHHMNRLLTKPSSFSSVSLTGSKQKGDSGYTEKQQITRD